MAALAGLLKESGYRLSGSDVHFHPPMGPQIKALDFPLREGYGADNIGKTVDLVVIGNAVSANNNEVEEIVRRGIPYLSFAEALHRFFLANTTNIVVAGTDGKTATTCLLAWILEVGGLDPGFMVGGIPLNFGANFRKGGGTLMVLEGDEYNTAFFDRRPKFVHYRPHSAILTSIEFDHADIYRNQDEITAAFALLFPLMPPDGYLLHCADFPPIQTLIPPSHEYAVESYGLTAQSSWLATYTGDSNHGMSFTLTDNRGNTRTMTSPLTGRQNLQNITACVAMARRFNVTWELIDRALASFRGVKKRQEILETIGDTIIMVDFAHHPTAIRETLKGLASRYPHKPLIAVFEPKTQTSRRAIFQREFAPALANAHITIIAPVYNPYNLPDSQLLSPSTLQSAIEKLGKVGYKTDNYDQIVNILLDVVRGGGVSGVHVVGGVGGGTRKVHERLPSADRRVNRWDLRGNGKG